MATIIDLKEKSLPDDCFVFKHSTICPISRMAADEVRVAALPLPVYWINVIQQRDLSTWIADTYGTRHESPQLLLFAGGKVAKVWNHYEIKAAHITQQ